jgi:hypothetical protein
MANRVCWHCGVNTHMAICGDAVIFRTSDGIRSQVAGPFTCDNCGAMSIAVSERPQSFGSLQPIVWLDRQERPIWIPRKALERDFVDVPPHIASTASEAYQCLDIYARRAAVQLARSVIEAAAKDKGITQGTLASKIDRMFEQGLIRQYIQEGAHEVRHLGNEMAHGDFVEPVSVEDADLVLTLMSEVLEEVYQSPARVVRARAARESRGKAAP